MPMDVSDRAAYFTILEAALYIGVSVSTLRNWDRSKKLEAERHPGNGYRVYRQDALDPFVVAKPRQRAPAKTVQPSGLKPRGGSTAHFIIPSID